MVLALAPAAQAAIVPITSVNTTTNTVPSPDTLILDSFTAGGTLYTTATDLVTGTSVDTDDYAGATNIGDQDNFDLNLYFGRGGSAADNAWNTSLLVGGVIWSDSNGSDADFFIFEAGGNDTLSVAPIFPDDSVGQYVEIATNGYNWGSTGVVLTEGARSNSTVYGVAFAITDLQDDVGDPLDNSTVIKGLAFDGPGTDIASISAVPAPDTDPAITSKNPDDGDTGVSIDANLVATFDENIVLTGSGTVTITNITDGTAAVINLPDLSQVTVSGAVLTINPTADLLHTNSYAVHISADAVEDLATTPNAFAGILDDTTWNFDTEQVDTTDPTITLPTAPADGATDVAIDANLVATFDENVALTGAGTITIKDLDTPADTVITLPDAQVSVSGAVLTIDPTADLLHTNSYAVQISADAVEDLATNAFAGILNDTTWNFDTAALAAGVYEHPGGLHTQAQLNYVRQKVIDQVEPWNSAYNQLLSNAVSWLSESPRAMAVFTVPRYYGDDQAEHTRVKTLMSEDARVAYSCALVYQLNINLTTVQREIYADKAKEFLNNWAYTNVALAGAEVEGYDSLLVMCYNGTALAFAAELLWDYSGWSTTDKNQFKSWAGTVLSGAASIKTRGNNWANWGIMASLAANHILDDTSMMASDIDRLKTIIDQQIEPDGSMPEELARDSYSIWYTYFALAPMTAAIEIARNADGIDLYPYVPPTGGTVKDALDFLFQHAIVDPSSWPVVGASNSLIPDGKGGNLFYAMGRVYGDEDYLNWVSHPIWRAKTGLCWICPSLMSPFGRNASTTDPTITLPTAPADGATDVATDANLVATFDENIALTGAGTITIKDLDTPADTVITLPDAQVSVSGAVLTINPTADLLHTNSYAVHISADAVEDLATTPNAFAGILDDTTWNFDTAAAVAGVTVVDIGVDTHSPLIDLQFPLPGTSDWNTSLTLDASGNAYAVFIDSNMKNTVAKVTPGGVVTTQIIDTNNNDPDGHNTPSIAIDGDGFLHVAYNMHGSKFREGMNMRKSPTANSVAGVWTDEGDQMPGSFTYPAMSTAPNGDVYLAIRNGTTGDPRPANLFHYDTSAGTWIDRGDFAQESGYTAYLPAPYVASDGKVHLVWHWAEGGPKGIRHLGSYAVYDPIADTFSKADGTPYSTITTTPITTTTADAYQPREANWNQPGISDHSVTVNALGQPIIAYNFFREGDNDQRVLRLARWDGSEWQRTDLEGPETGTTLGDPVIVNRDGTLHIYYSDADRKLTLRSSADNGLTFGDAITLTDHAVRAAHVLIGGTSIGTNQEAIFFLDPSENYAAKVMFVAYGPEIDITGNGNSITNGDITPILGDHTDFGSTYVGGSTIVKTYTVTNSGGALLTLTDPATVSGAGEAQFAVGALTDPTLNNGETATFTVTYTASAGAAVHNATVSLVNDDSDENPYTFTITAETTAAAEPEIDVTGNSVSIPDGDTTPSTGDHTDFGSTIVGGSTIVKTYTVENSGALLTLTDPATVSGTGAAQFAVGTLTDTTLNNGETATFTVTYTASAGAAVHNATVSLVNDDGDENPYDFAITAETEAAIPEIDVTGNSVSIPDGDTTADLADDTDFGNTFVGGPTIVKTYTVENTGTALLTLTDPATVSGAGEAQFAVGALTDPTLNNGETATFTVTYTASAGVAVHNATVSLANDDSDENPYNFAITAETTAPLVIYVFEDTVNDKVDFAWNGIIGASGTPSFPTGTPTFPIPGAKGGTADHFRPDQAQFQVANRSRSDVDDADAGDWSPHASYAGSTFTFGTGESYSDFVVDSDIPFAVNMYVDSALSVGQITVGGSYPDLATQVFIGSFSIPGTLASRGLFTTGFELPHTLWTADSGGGSIVFAAGTPPPSPPPPPPARCS